jgi:glycosyltransferase involved in cell wall biosynthesis
MNIIKKDSPLVCCLTSTFGRISKLNEAVTCFIEQDYDNKKLIILNNHPVPLTCDFPNVTVHNEPIYPSLGDCRNRLIDLAEGDFIRTWDDDDLYMPWTSRQGVENIGASAAWKPTRSWFWVKDKSPELAQNVFEAAMIVRMDVAKKYRYLSASGGNEHETLIKGINAEGGCAEKEMGNLASYVYRWGWGMWHISGTCGSNMTIDKRTEDWKSHNLDTQDGIIKRVDIKPFWLNFPT